MNSRLNAQFWSDTQEGNLGLVKNIQCHAALKGCGGQDVCDPMPRLPRGGKDLADKQQRGTRTGRARSGWTSSPTTSPAGTWPRGGGLTSPSLPSQGSLALMGGKAPPPTGAVEPRPKESSLRGKDQSECVCMNECACMNNAFSICAAAASTSMLLKRLLAY